MKKTVIALMLMCFACCSQIGVTEVVTDDISNDMPVEIIKVQERVDAINWVVVKDLVSDFSDEYLSADNNAKLIEAIKAKLIAEGLTEEEASDLTESVLPVFVRIGNAIRSKNKQELISAMLAFIIALISLYGMYVRVKNRNKVKK